MIFINCSLIKKRLQIDVPQQDSILFYEIKLDISEVSKILILVLILKSKTRKTRKFFKTSKLEWISFICGNWGFPRFPSFRFWLLCRNQKLGKLRHFFKSFLLEEVGNFRGFRVFDFDPYTEIENSENSEIFTTLVNSKECVLP